MAGRGDRGTFNLGFSNGMDPESGRCRRTDGKKWRCSRNAAPDQKYCERHMHRGRPRSRKPVEVSKTKRTSTNTLPITANSPTIVTTTTTTTTTSLSKPLPSQSSGLFPKDELESPFQSLEPNREPRSDGMKGNGEEMESSLRWELMHSKIGLRHGTTPPVLQYHEGQLNLNYAAFLNPDLCSLEENAIGNRGEASRSFIDAWSSETPAATAEDGNSTTSVPTTGELPLSTLTLSMSSTGEGTDHQIQMAPVSPFGGPLGEALQTSSATSPRHGFGANGRDSSSGGLISILSHGFHGSHEVSPQVGFLSFWSPAESLGFAFRQQ